MKRNHGNQHVSLRRFLLGRLELARAWLGTDPVYARLLLAQFWAHHAGAPASTRRRWRCGH
jgi:hypothetical protein